MSTPVNSPGRNLLVLLCLLVLMLSLLWSTVGKFVEFRELFPGGAGPDLQKALTALHSGDVVKARQILDRVVGAHPDDAEIYVGIGALCEQQAQWNMAIDYLQRGLNTCRDASKETKGELYSLLSNAYSEIETVRPQAHAIDAARNAWKLAPADPVRQNQLGYIEADNGVDLDEAQQLITRALQALKAEPDTPEIDADIAATEDSYGWLLYKEKRYSEAAAALAQAVADIPGDALSGETRKVLYYHLGAAYRQAGSPDAARRALETALEYDPNYAEAQAELKALPPASAQPANPPLPAPQRPAIKNS